MSRPLLRRAEPKNCATVFSRCFVASHQMHQQSGWNGAKHDITTSFSPLGCLFSLASFSFAVVSCGDKHNSWLNDRPFLCRASMFQMNRSLGESLCRTKQFTGYAINILHICFTVHGRECLHVELLLKLPLVGAEFYFIFFHG